MPAAAPAAARLTAEDVSAFLDGMLPSAMAIGDIAGAAVAVVRDGEILALRGYGFADVDGRVPVDASGTLFRPASISKLFTWTAVMQLVEAGRLDLDRDINDYLDFRVTGLGGQPITMRHLMTHTAGFEESLQDLLVDDAGRLEPLGAMLRKRLPRPLHPPGAVPAYSNYGSSLAGYIVERISGLPFEQYVEQHIFAPLGMSDSTFRQPVPEPLASRLSRGYVRASGKPVPFEFGSDVPAGALSATAADMARFMIAHLNGGSLPDAGESSRILQPQTVRQMHAVANRPAPGIDAMALGFYEQSRNGVRVIAHGGDLIAFHSELVLIPEAKVGLFVSFNSRGRDNFAYDLRTALFEGFMDRYFPQPPRTQSEPPQMTPEALQRTRAAEGTYELSRRAQSSLFSFVYVLSQQRAVMRSDGGLEMTGLRGLNGQPKVFREIEPWIWQEVGGQTRIAALRNDAGEVTALAPDGFAPIFIFQRVPVWRDQAWLLPAMLGAAVVLATTLLWRLVAAVRRRLAREREDRGTARGLEVWLRRTPVAASLACAGFALLAGVIVASFSGTSLWILSSEARPLLRLTQLAALLSVLGAAAMTVVAVRSWLAPGERRGVALGRSLLCAACLVWAYVAIVFNFLSIRLHY